MFVCCRFNLFSLNKTLSPNSGHRLNSAVDDDVYVPFALLKRVGDAVFARTRVNHTFRAWARSHTNKTGLSKGNFKVRARVCVLCIDSQCIFQAVKCLNAPVES